MTVHEVRTFIGVLSALLSDASACEADADDGRSRRLGRAKLATVYETPCCIQMFSTDS